MWWHWKKKEKKIHMIETLKQAKSLVFQDSKDPFMQEVYRKMIYPEMDSLPTNASEGFRRLCARDKYAFFAEELDIESKRANLPCTIIHVPGTTIVTQLSMAVQKGSPHKGLLDH
jgi:hypothetical protein